MERKAFEEYINGILHPEAFHDDAVNGLQVEGRDEIIKVAAGVSASLAMFHRAADWGADAVIVHHGLLWERQDPRIRQAFKNRLRILLENNISLFAWHLPLDAHPEIGNNAQIALKLGLTGIAPFGEYHGTLIGLKALTDLHTEELLDRVIKLMGKPVHHIPGGPDRIHSVGIVSGGAQKEFLQAADAGLDAYITGEISEYNVELAAELGCHFIAAGHYRTERFGIQALAEKINLDLNVDAQFFDLPHPY